MMDESEIVVAGEQAHVLIDALPYIDAEYENPAVQAHVRSLVEKEMAAMKPRDYLSHLPTPPPLSFPNNPVLQAEMVRLGKGERMPPLDISRYDVPGPAKELARDMTAWRSAVANARAQLEQQHNRLANLQLLERYGAQAFLQQNGALTAFERSLSAEADAAGKAAEAANLKRKVTQERSAPRVRTLSLAYGKALGENQQLEIAVALLKRDVKRLRGDAEAKGLVPTEAMEAAARAEAEAKLKGSGLNGGTVAGEVDLYAGGEVTGMAD